MRICCLQHAAFEGPARVSDWARARGHAFITTELFRRRPLPELEEFDWLVALGGPMGVHDDAEHSWLKPEKRLIERSLRAGKPVLGVCLGAQLVADVLGARVCRNQHKEVGWLPVRRSPSAFCSHIFHSLPPEFIPFHWHADTFDLPAGSLKVAESKDCQNQAFECGLAWGLQFHLEVTPDAVTALVENCAAEICFGPYQQSAEAMLDDPIRFVALEPVLNRVLDRISVVASVR